MPHYLWKGVNVQGNPMEGAIESLNTDEVLDALRKQDIFRVRFKRIFARQLKFPLNQDRLIHFLIQLHRLLDAGMGLIDCLNFIIRHQNNISFSYILCTLRQDIQEGKSLTESFQRFTGCFPLIFIHLIQVAEKTGKLQEVLKDLSNFFMFQNKFTKERRKLLTYPLFVLGIALILFLGIALFVVPTFKTMFLSSNSDLPLMTKGLILLSDSLRFAPEYWIMGTLGAIFGGVYLFRWIDWSRFLSFIPIFRGMEQSVCLMFYARSMRIMLQSGIQLREALALSESLFPKRLQKEIHGVHQQIDSGKSLSEAYKSSRTFPLLFVNLIALGESSGYLVPTFERIGSLYQEILERRMSIFNSLVEPLLTICLAFGVLILLLSIYLPIFDIAVRF